MSMKTKFLYVLVSNLADYYSEQCYLSICSLKLKNPNAFISLLVDEQTALYLEQHFIILIQSVNEYKVVALDHHLSNKEKSRVLKSSMRQQINGDFLFIDCDTVICDDLSEIEQIEGDIACVLDSHILVSDHWAKDWMKKNNKKCGFIESITKEKHFNSGVIYCKDTSHTRVFFEDWSRLMKQSIASEVYIDQPAFNHADTINGNLIKELHGKWNCQLVQGGVKYLAEAKIIHYFASQKKFRSPYLLADKNILKDIRNKKGLSERCISLLNNPKNVIDEKTRLLSPDVPTELFFQHPFFELVYIYNNHKLIYQLIRIVCFLLGKLHK